MRSFLAEHHCANGNCPQGSPGIAGSHPRHKHPQVCTARPTGLQPGAIPGAPSPRPHQHLRLPGLAKKALHGSPKQPSAGPYCPDPPNKGRERTREKVPSLTVLEKERQMVQRKFSLCSIHNARFSEIRKVRYPGQCPEDSRHGKMLRYYVRGYVCTPRLPVDRWHHLCTFLVPRRAKECAGGGQISSWPTVYLCLCLF